MNKLTRFRLFRSRAFWFGVPGLAFLLWAWADSVKTSTTCWGGKNPLVHLTQEENYLQLQLTRFPATAGSSSWTWGGERTPRATTNIWPRWIYRPQWRHFDDPGGWKGSIHTSPATFDQWILPHWFMVLLYVLPWSGAVAWLWRKRSRLTAAPPPSDCGDDSSLLSSR
jgi:hypothetical protein